MSSKTDRPAPSLRLRLVMLAALTIVVAMVLGGLELVAIFDRHLERRVAQELSVRLLELAGGFAVVDGAPVLTTTLTDPRYAQPQSGAYWQISDAAGPRLRSRSLWDATLATGASPEQASFIAPGPGGTTLVMMQRSVRLAGDGAPRSFRLEVALDHAELDDLGASFRADTLLALSLIGGVLIAGAWLQLVFGLQPLQRLQAELARVRAGRTARLAGRFPAEVAPLAASLNAVLDQQEDSVRKARERAGDLAHGLKTPLTILLGEARRLEACGQTEAAGRLREQIGHMHRHVDRQLARARSHGATSAGGTLTDASAIVARMLGLMRLMPQPAELTWRNALPASLRLRMDPEDFGEVMGNLLDNARLWARSEVAVQGLQDGDCVRIVIDDDGPGIRAEHRAVLRGRGETGRPPGAGTGLGLAIVADVLGQYGATLDIEDAPGGGCRVAFELTGWAEE